MFAAVRMAVFAVISALGFFAIKKSKIKKKKLTLILLIAANIGLSVLSEIFPPENLFITFNSLDSVAKYYGAQDIAYTLEGEDSYFIVYEESKGTYTACIAKKANGGYKIATAGRDLNVINMIRGTHSPQEYARTSVYKVRGTNDIFLWGDVEVDDKNAQMTVVDADGNTICCKIYTSAKFESHNYAPYSLRLCICINSKDWSDELFLVADGKKLVLI